MIPEIDVRSLSAKKIYEGNLDFSYLPEEGLLGIPFVAFSSPVRAVLSYRISEGGDVEVKGKLVFSLKGECSRCRSFAEEMFEGEVYGLFETPEGDGETYGYKKTVVLTELLRDALLFALPSRLLCKACENEVGETE